MMSETTDGTKENVFKFVPRLLSRATSSRNRLHQLEKPYLRPMFVCCRLLMNAILFRQSLCHPSRRSKLKLRLSPLGRLHHPLDVAIVNVRHQPGLGYNGNQGCGYTAEVVDYMVNMCESIQLMPSKAEKTAAYRDFLRFDPDEGDCETAMRAFVASKSNPDILRFHEAMMADDADGFRTAMDLEISNLERMLTWCVVPCPEGANVLQGTWAFVRKRYPDGRIRKLKARFCVGGDQQVEGIDYFDSYAPVVQWSTVRVILIMTIVFGLATRQIDYNNAFAQSDLKEDVYVEIPRGYGKPEGDMVLKLNKTLYGLVQAPKAFYDHMLTGLENCGF
jgi:hypothetical protein